MKRLFAKIASACSSNRPAQVCLLGVAWAAEYLMGIGAGSDVNSSGEASVLTRFAKDGVAPVIFDVGSNRGQFFEMSAKALRTVRFQMHCFEPSKAAYAFLAEATQGTRFVTSNNIALGREPGERMLFADQSGSRLASFTKRRIGHFGKVFAESETVRVDTVDNYCARNGITHIDLLKLDVEGHELEVLAGASEMLRKRAIRYVSFEFGGCNIDTHSFVQDYWYFFQGYGMRVARITPGGYWFELGAYREIYEQFRTQNFVAYQANDN
jgi:FkbM family methyltransferase